MLILTSLTSINTSSITAHKSISCGFQATQARIWQMFLLSYLLDTHVLSPHQYAYRPRHSTEDALIDAVEWISKVVDNGEVASMTTIDLSKAFDSVDHGVLLDKLEWYGVRSDWFRSYLHDRKQTVPGGADLILPLTHGVAQGSIVGPILFLILINDLSSFLPHGRLLSYADDTQLLDHSPPDVISISHLQSRVADSMQQLQAWFQSNSLKMNPDKTNFILFGTKSSIAKASDSHITLPGSVIILSPTVKVLGITFDPCMTWEHHISVLVRKCNAILLSLYKIRHYFTPHALELLVQVHVFPHIMYCMSVWGGAAQCHLSRVQKVMNFAARLVTGVRRSEHISPALKSLGWSDVGEMVRRRDCLKVFGALTDCDSPQSLRSLFVRRSNVSERVTRATAAGDLHLKRCRLSVTQRTFAYRAARAWNALPANVTAMPSCKAFMNAMCRPAGTGTVGTFHWKPQAESEQASKPGLAREPEPCSPPRGGFVPWGPLTDTHTDGGRRHGPWTGPVSPADLPVGASLSQTHTHTHTHL